MLTLCTIFTFWQCRDNVNFALIGLWYGGGASYASLSDGSLFKVFLLFLECHIEIEKCMKRFLLE